MTLETLRINFASPYHGQIITKIALELVAPSYETNSRVMSGKQIRVPYEIQMSS